MQDIETPCPPGWIDDPELVQQVAEAQPVQSFGDTPAGQDTTELPPQVYLWQAQVTILGMLLLAQNQGAFGTCVGTNNNEAVHTSSIWSAAHLGYKIDFKRLVIACTYAGSRNEVAGGRFGRGDGSSGAAAAEFLRKWGAIPSGIHGKYDLSKYDGDLCRSWGRPGAGVPDDLEPELKLNPVKSITKITTVDEARRSLANGISFAICSNQGFSMVRDKEGFCAPSGRWSHCMSVDGYQTGKRPGFRVKNSWGTEVFKGPVGAGDPTADGFWCDEEVMARILAYGDSWALGLYEGFPKKIDQVDWSLYI